MVVTEAPPPPTFTVTAQSVVITEYFASTRTLPALCQPTNFKEYSKVVSPQESESRHTPANSEADCCENCYNAKNCGYFRFRPDAEHSTRCESFVGIKQTDPSPYTDICPLGVAKNSFLSEPAGADSGRFLFNYGPCLSSSPLNG